MKTNKVLTQILSVCLLAVLFVAPISCSKNNSSAQNNSSAKLQPSPSGVDSGGGNTGQSRQVSEDEVVTAIENAKPYIDILFRYYELVANQEVVSNATFYKLVRLKPEPLLDFLKRFEKKALIKVKREGCNMDGHDDNDGSYDDSQEPPVCISSGNLVRKLNSDNLNKEVFALLAHELAHARGLNEAEAVSVQNHARRQFEAGFAYLEMIDSAWNVRNFLANDYNYQRVSKIEPGIMELFNHRFQRPLLMQSWNAVRPHTYTQIEETLDGAQSIVGFEGVELLVAVNAKAASVWYYFCTQDPITPPDTKRECAEQVGNIFQISNELSVNDFNKRYSYPLPGMWRNLANLNVSSLLKVSKIMHDQGLRRELKEIRDLGNRFADHWDKYEINQYDSIFSVIR